MADVIMYHENCNDGWCAAWIAKSVSPNATLISCKAGEPLDREVLGPEDTLLIVDLSITTEEILWCKDNLAAIEIIDHHKTARHLANCDIAVFDESKSAAMLTWEFFHPHKPAPWFVNYVQDRDLWKWELPNSREINEYLALVDKSRDAWNMLLLTSPDQAAMTGKILLTAKQKHMERILINAAPLNLALLNIKCWAVNSPIFQSELGNELAKKSENHIGCVYWMANEHTYFSLRSIGDVDVSILAKSMGGGGHKNAANFKIRLTEDNLPFAVL